MSNDDGGTVALGGLVQSSLNNFLTLIVESAGGLRVTWGAAQRCYSNICVRVVDGKGTTDTGHLQPHLIEKQDGGVADNGTCN